MAKFPSGTKIVNGSFIFTIEKNGEDTEIIVEPKSDLEITEYQEELLSLSNQELVDQSIKLGPDHYFTRSGIQTLIEQGIPINPLTGEPLTESEIER